MNRTMRRTAVVGIATVATLVITAAPSFAYQCGNANKKPDAGLVTFKDQGARAATTAPEHARAYNATGTGAFGDAVLFYEEGEVEPGYVIFARNDLHPAAQVGSSDHGVIQVVPQ
jgi:hypothetical protein